MLILQKATLALIIFTLVPNVGCKTQAIEPEPSWTTPTTEMSYAKPYLVLGEGNMVNERADRKVGLWFIVSKDATSYEEWAQTAIQAVRDLYCLYGRDYTSVDLIPNDKLEYAIDYAQVSYASDGKGALGMTGDTPAKEMYWKVRAAVQPLTRQELAIAELWSEKMRDFPNKNPISSLSYDEKALRQYVADKLNISVAEVIFPQIIYKEYKYDERL